MLALAPSGPAAATSVLSPEGDTLTHVLPSVDVRGKRVRSHLDMANGVSVMDMEMLELMPRILGNADPMHYAQLLPGVQTNSEYDAGLHIQGCESSHNMVAIDGVPLYNVEHLLGFFSIFNATHFSSLHLSKSPIAPAMPNRLGGVADMHTADTIARRTGGDVSVGPMSSQATIRLPLGRQLSLTLSAREAYLNLLYGRWLDFDGDKMRYSFGDYNLSLLYQPDEHNTLHFEGYFGHDNVGVKGHDYLFDSRLRWGNMMAAVHWLHLLKGGSLSQSVYFTAHRNRFGLEQADINVRIASDIHDLGYKALLTFGRLKAGVEAVHHSMQPQEPHAGGVLNGSDEAVLRQKSLEASLFASWRLPLSRRIDLEGGLRATGYGHGPSRYFSADPGATLSWHVSPLATLSLNAGIKHQYLFQTGFSNMGLPTEFWFSAGGSHRPQYSCNTSLSLDAFSADKTWRVACEVYYKRLFHQVEYNGNVFDFVYSTYSLDAALLHGHGHNCGLNLMVEKRKGRLTGWLSYAFGRAKRRYPGTGLSASYSAAHERPHELNAVATCKLGRRWSIGTTFVAASGTPYTKVERFYLLSNNILADYGQHNASRLPMYLRLDLSANYEFRLKGGRRSGINLSIYNVTMHDNPLLYRLKVTRKDHKVVYSAMSFVAPLLPSVNYYYSF